LVARVLFNDSAALTDVLRWRMLFGRCLNRIMDLVRCLAMGRRVMMGKSAVTATTLMMMTELVLVELFG
jgi:hypothetical protein